MTSLTPLIELASHRSLDLFFRVGQGYVARSAAGRGQRHGGGFGLSPLGVEARAQMRIVAALPPPSPDARLHVWPGGPQRPRPPAFAR